MSEINMDLPNNSQKGRQAQNDTQKEKPAVPVFDGKTGTQKRKGVGFWKYMRRMFLSDRKPSDILKDIFQYRIVPGIKDNARNAIMSTVDMFMYEGSNPTQTNSNNSVNYNKIFNGNRGQQNNPPPQKTDSKQEEINKGFQNPCFQTRRDAENFLNNYMKSYDYETLSVHTLYMMLGKHIDYTWDSYGWTREEILALDPKTCIRHMSRPELPEVIVLPQAHIIA